MKLSTLLLVVGSLLSLQSISQTQTTIAGLRSSGSATVTYFITDPGKQGLFYYDAKDASSADNGGTVIVSAGKRFKREYSGAIDGRWFGMVADYNGTTGTDNLAGFNAAINAAGKGQTVMVPSGQFLVKGNVVMPLTTVKKVNIEIFGDIYFTKGYGFIIEGMNQEFRSYGLLSGGNAGGTTEATYAAYAGTGIYLKNAYNCHIEVNEIKDFKDGIHQSGDKSGGTPDGSQFNKVYFNAIHHNHTQIRLSIKGSTSSAGNWNNETYWFGGQLGRGVPGVTYGKGGWYGIVCSKDASSNASFPIDGHMFHDIGFEGLEKALVMANSSNISFIGGGIEPQGCRYGFDLDPVTVTGIKFIGFTYIEEQQFVSGRLGINTVISATPIWTGVDPNKSLAGNEAVSSVTANKFIITANKYTPTSFNINKTHDLISKTGEFPTVQAMNYRINGVGRTVPFKGTFLHVKSSTAGSPLVLPPNIGTIRVEANQAKIFKIDVGDMAIYGEGFIVEYLTPQYPISFVRADNSAVLIAATNFPSGGIYRCLFADGQYKVSKIGAEFKTFTQTGAAYLITEGIETHYVNYAYGNAVTTLPPAEQWPGRTIIVKNMQAAKTVQISGVSASDDNLIAGRGAVTLKSDGVSWNIIGFYKRGLTY
ncbi:MAG: hypothetical protein ABI687_05855 [Flavitalea sp.]